MTRNSSAPGLREQDTGANDCLRSESAPILPYDRRKQQEHGFRLHADPLHNPYGLTAAELRAEIRRRSREGWQLWELRARFAAPERCP